MACTENYLRIEYKNTCDLGSIYYSGSSFSNILFFKTALGRPEYVTEEEGFKNGDGIFIKTAERTSKKYGFKIVAPEYIADALKFMALHDTITIRDTLGRIDSIDARNVEVSIGWADETNSCLAEIEVKFQANAFIVDSACCNNLVAD